VAVTVTQLRDHVNVGPSEVTDAALGGYLTAAAALLDDYLIDVPATEPVPEAIVDRSLLLVAAEMFGQDQAPNGILNQQFDTADGVTSLPVRVTADPLRPAYGLLSRWVPPVVA
jgi:hypothetical protein